MKRSRFPLKAEINLVPFIDIVLVLLVVFMITTPIVTQGVKVDLPKVTTQPIPQNTKDNWIITVTREGALFLDMGTGKRTSNTPMSVKEISGLARIKSRSSPTLTIFVRADRNITYGKLMDLLGELQSNGVAKVGLVTNPLDEKR